MIQRAKQTEMGPARLPAFEPRAPDGSKPNDLGGLRWDPDPFRARNTDR
jgi:hypothetical protein